MKDPMRSDRWWWLFATAMVAFGAAVGAVLGLVVVAVIR